MEAARRGLPVRARATSTTTSRSPTSPAPSTSSTWSGAPAATTRSTWPSRRGSSATSSTSSRSTGWSTRAAHAWRRVVVEKPFGHDLESAAELQATLAEAFPPESIFRIDHYLGKETVQNILAMRFANEMFEPLWNANYVDHVQITMAEDIGIGGRAGYYDGIGAARDVIQNHLLQLMALVAMEEPISFDADEPARREAEGPQDHHPPPAPRPVHGPRAVRRGLVRRREGAGFLRRRASSRARPPRLRRGHPAHRQPSLGRGAVLPAHRQAARPAGDRGGHRLQARRRTCRSPRTPPRS